MAIGTILGVVGGIAGGVLGAVGASKQAKAAEQASAAAIAEQRRQFDISMRTLQPWFQAGGQAVQRLAFLLGLGSPTGQAAGAPTGGTPLGPVRPQPELPGGRGPGNAPILDGGIDPALADRFAALRGMTVAEGAGGGGLPPGVNPGDFGSLMRDFSMADFEADPGYAFRISEGMKALERSASARGGLFGGGTLRAITRYGQDMGSQEYLNAYNRFQQNRNTRYNFLAGLAGLGQQSAGQLVAAGHNTANNIANLIVGGQTAAAAARASGYGALGGALANAPLNYYLLSQMQRQG